MTDHPLDEALGVSSSEEVKSIFGMDVELPENPMLRDVVMFALKEYKNLTEEAQLLEPENKLATLELAKEYLNLAKDTMYKQSDLEIKHKNADIRAASQKKKTKDLPSPEEEGGSEGSQRRISREELIEMNKGSR